MGRCVLTNQHIKRHRTSHLPLLYRMNSKLSSMQMVASVWTCPMVVTSQTYLPHSSTPWLHFRTWASTVAVPQASMCRQLPPGMHLPSLPPHHHQALLHAKLPAGPSTLSHHAWLPFVWSHSYQFLQRTHCCIGNLMPCGQLKRVLIVYFALAMLMLLAVDCHNMLLHV